MTKTMQTEWQSRWYAAPGHLAGVLAGVWSVSAGSNADLRARVLPDGSTSLVFQRDGTVLRSATGLGSRWNGASVSGPRTASFDFKLDAGGQFWIVQLHAVGAMHALGVPMKTLADRFESLDAVLCDGAVEPVRAKVALAPDDVHAVALIEEWLGERLRRAMPPCPLTTALVREVTRTSGGIRVADLAGHANLSRRHLGRIMIERVGASPKTFARVTRFDHAVQRARAFPQQSWAAIAHEVGYADQAHLAREFTALGKIRPSDLRGAGSATIW